MILRARRNTHPADRRAVARRAAVLLWVLPALAAVAAATLWWISGPAVEPATPAKVQNPASSVEPATRLPTGIPAKTDTPHQAPAVHQSGTTKPSLAELQRLVVGEWTGFYQGQRSLSVREGGLATMTAEPEGVAAFLLAAKLTFNVKWTINGDQLEFETISGEPADKVAVVVKMYGRKRTHRILSLHPDRLELLDEDGVTKYLWTRTSPAPASTSGPQATRRSIPLTPQSADRN